MGIDMLAMTNALQVQNSHPRPALKIVANSSPTARQIQPATSDVWASLQSRQQPTVLKAGESLFFQADIVEHVYILKEGWAFRYQCLEDGRRQIVDFLLPGEILGLGDSVSMTCGVEALTEASFARFPRGEFMNLLRDRPELTHCLMSVLWAGQERAFEHVTSVGRRTAKERVSHLLLELIRRVRKMNITRGNAEMNLPLMQPHIGDALGLASETVCRCLSDLRKNGILVLRSGHLEVLNIDRLATEAGVDLEDLTDGFGGVSGVARA